MRAEKAYLVLREGWRSLTKGLKAGRWVLGGAASLSVRAGLRHLCRREVGGRALGGGWAGAYGVAVESCSVAWGSQG